MAASPPRTLAAAAAADGVQAPIVSFVTPERELRQPEEEATNHGNMALGFDMHMRRRGDIDRHLSHLGVEAAELHHALDALASGAPKAEDEDPAAAATARTVSQLRDEVAMLDAQLAAVDRLVAARGEEVADLRATLSNRRLDARQRYGVSELRSLLRELHTVEERIRQREDELLELSKMEYARLEESARHARDAEGLTESLRAQRDDLAARVAEMEVTLQSTNSAIAQLRARGAASPNTQQQQSGGRYLTAPGITLSSPAEDSSTGGGASSSVAGASPLPQEVSWASDTEAQLRTEIGVVRQDIAALRDTLQRDGLPVDGSPRERFLARKFPDAMLSKETLIRIMRLLKASLFNLAHDIDMIEATVVDIIRSRDEAPDVERWGHEQVGHALVKAAQYATRPYAGDVGEAEKVARRLRRLVLVCDTVDGVTAEWVVEHAERRNIAPEVSQFYEVAMECRTMINDERRRRRERDRQRRELQQSATKGKVLATLGLRRPSQSFGRYQASSRTPSQQAYAFPESDSEAAGYDQEEEEEEEEEE